MNKLMLPLLLLASTAFAQQQPLETISVSGTAKARMTPDRATFTVGVQTMAPTVEEAVNENNTRVAAVIAALKKVGAADSEVRTSNFSINPQQQYVEGKPPRILGYDVQNSVVVTRSDISSTGKLLQAAVNAGVNNASGISLEISDRSRGRDGGLKAAFDDAKSKAAVLAAAAGRTVGRALSISEGMPAQPPRPIYAQAMNARAAEVSEVPVEAGTQEVGYTVSVIFELR